MSFNEDLPLIFETLDCKNKLWPRTQKHNGIPACCTLLRGSQNYTTRGVTVDILMTPTLTETLVACDNILTFFFYI